MKIKNTSNASDFPDPFAQSRQQKGLGHMDDQNDPVDMILRLKDVRKTAHNAAVFKSGVLPGRIVIPSEVSIRKTRQIPFELDPPEHGPYRNLLNAWFKRPQQKEYQEKLQLLIDEAILEAFRSSASNAGAEAGIDVVSEFALPLQSKALTLLLNTSEDEAQTWIDWGTHVFRSENSPIDGDKANILYDYIDQKIEQASKQTHSNDDSKDLYSVLLESEVNGKKLSKEEVKGVMVLTFAGGRDTVINAITNTIAYFSDNIGDLHRIAESPELVNTAVEELLRYFSPLTQMGRVVADDAQICEHAIKADTRVSLCWASANRDESVFSEPDKVDITRKVNPHVSFGFSHHNCLGATHARQILRQLVASLAEKVSHLEVLNAKENIEHLGEYTRKVGFDYLRTRFLATSKPA